MGCSQSSAAAAAAAAAAAGTTTKTNSAPKGTTIDTLGKVTDVELRKNKQVQVSSMTRQNYYPDKTKPNQDSCVAYRFKASDGSTVHTFAVLDGHGENGHNISQWVAQNLPVQIEKECQKIVPEGPTMDKSEVEKACFDAHVACQKALLSEEDIDRQWSGTTCCSIVVWSGGITVCNLGDSRVVIGEFVTATQNDQKILFAAKALSHDHIPLRKDERDRVKKSGARVITIGQAAGQDEINEEEDDHKWTTSQKEGEERIYTEDPPRIFAPEGMYPGYQFTRSFGDAGGRKFGLIAEPEISTMRFLSTIGLIVLATDGVTEYLTDQDVIDVCALFQNPKDACEAVIELAYKNWIDKDVRTDDITITCIHCNRENIDPLSLSMSVRNGTRKVSAPSHDEKSGLPNFPNLTVECIKEYIKTGRISQKDFSRVGLRSNESFLFGEEDISALQDDKESIHMGDPAGNDDTPVF